MFCLFFSLALDSAFLGAADAVFTVKKWIQQLEPAFVFLSGTRRRKMQFYNEKIKPINACDGMDINRHPSHSN
jgi:hypothetical protein